jgi:aminomethyltransferase
MATTDTQALRRTVLYDEHVKLKGQIIPFAGWEMPVRYSSDLEEHLCVREKVGIFDVSHMGEFLIKGPSALALIQKVTTNDASKLTPGKAQYSCFPNGKGGIVDDCIVYMKGENDYMIVVNAGNIAKDWDWINKQNDLGATLENVSDDYSLFSVSGPLAAATVAKLTDMPVGDLAYYTFATGTFNGIPNILIATTGYTGEKCFEILIPNEHAVKCWVDLMEAGKEFGIQPIGLGARDTLRLEMGYMLYGNDIDDTTSPLEAGLGWITKLAKGSFIDSDKLTQQKADGLKRKLVGFEMIDRGIPRHDYVLSSGGNVIGKVTSGSQSPSLKKGIGMGYVEAAFATEGTEIDVIIRDKPVKAKVVKPPFLKR